jgi:hypothetical protein
MYKLNKTSEGDLTGVFMGNVFIPFDEANTDYIQFKKDLIEGAELQNAEGEVMTKADITEFMRSLP